MTHVGHAHTALGITAIYRLPERLFVGARLLLGWGQYHCIMALTPQFLAI
jgi:hypothetical protein